MQLRSGTSYYWAVKKKVNDDEELVAVRTTIYSEVNGIPDLVCKTYSVKKGYIRNTLNGHYLGYSHALEWDNDWVLGYEYMLAQGSADLPYQPDRRQS